MGQHEQVAVGESARERVELLEPCTRDQTPGGTSAVCGLYFLPLAHESVASMKAVVTWVSSKLMSVP